MRLLCYYVNATVYFNKVKHLETPELLIGYNSILLILQINMFVPTR